MAGICEPSDDDMDMLNNTRLGMDLPIWDNIPGLILAPQLSPLLRARRHKDHWTEARTPPPWRATVVLSSSLTTTTSLALDALDQRISEA